jgi:hypothetical protein
MSRSRSRRLWLPGIVVARRAEGDRIGGDLNSRLESRVVAAIDVGRTECASDRSPEHGTDSKLFRDQE